MGTVRSLCLPPEDRHVAWTHTRSQIAVAIKKDPDADVTELRRQLQTERLADHIQRVVDAAPPLTNAQRDRLAVLLRGGADV